MAYIIMAFLGIIAAYLIKLYLIIVSEGVYSGIEAIKDLHCLRYNYVEPYRKFFIEICTILSFLYVCYKAEDIKEIIGFTLYIIILLAASFEDIKSREISNVVPVALILTGIVNIIISGNIFGRITAFLVFGGIFLLLSFILKGSIGLGDVRIISCSAFALGFERMFGSLVISLVLVFLTSIILLIFNRMGRKGVIPFAPFILLGFLVSIY